jgi:hypothetical protein
LRWEQRIESNWRILLTMRASGLLQGAPAKEHPVKKCNGGVASTARNTGQD